MATGGGYPGPCQGKATSGTAVWYETPILQVGKNLIRRRLEPEINDLLEAAYQQREWKVSFTDKDTGSNFTACLVTKRLCYGNTTYALLERVYEELQPDRKRVDRVQSPQISNTNKPNDAKERQMMAEQYKCMSSQLVACLQKVTNGILQRDFPTNLKDMKEELTEIGRIQTDDIPKWTETRKEIVRIFQDLQNDFAQPVSIDERLGPGSIEELWIQFNYKMAKREARLTAEIARLETLESQLKKLDEDTKHLDDRLDDIEHRIRNVKKYKDMDYSLQARKDTVALERELEEVDDGVRCILKDVETLQKGEYSSTHQILRRLLQLQSKSCEIRTLMFSSFILKPSQPSLTMMPTAQYRKASNGAQMVETNPVIKHVQDCLHWISTKQATLEDACYDNDINLIEKALFQHSQEHQSIQVYKNEVEICTKEREKLYKEEQERFSGWHSKVQEAYKKLLDTSVQRLSWLQSLQDFVQKAVKVLDWLQKKIELICSCSPDLDRPFGQIYQIVSQEMKDNEVYFISIQDHGHSLVRKTHPAKTTIEVYISKMLSKWSWLQELLNCLHQHIQGIRAYNQFFQEAQSCEQWINRQTEHVNNCMSNLEKIPFEKFEQMKKECQDLQNAIVEYEKKVALLAKTSHDIIPLQQLNQQVTSAVKVHCVCTYEQSSMSLQLHEECYLLDTSQKIYWLVKNSRGQQDTVPSICLMISPPNLEARALADRLTTLLDQLKTIVKTYDWKLTENIVMAIIEFIRTWDLEQFQSLGPTSCEVLLTDLNDWAAKLIAEAGDADQKLQKQLKKDLDECNSKVQEFSKKLCEEARALGRGFCSKEVKSTVSQSLEMKSKQLTIQHNTQDHPQTAENDLRKKLKAVQDSGDPLIIPSVFGSGTVTVNPGVVKYMNASHVLDDRLRALEEQYGLKSQRNGYVLKLSGQADELLSSANLLLHDIKRVPNKDRETKMPHKCQDEFLNAWKNREVEGLSASEPDKTDVPSSFPSKKDLSQVYLEYKTEVAGDVLNSIKITYGQKGIDSLISDLDQFAKVEMYQGRAIVHCEYKHAENVQKCVKSHYKKATKERKTTEGNKHLIQGGNENLKEWLQFAYCHASWSKNLQLEGGKLYFTGTSQMKKEVEKAVHSVNYLYKEEFALTSEEQQKAGEVVTLVKSAFPSIFIKRTRETLIILSDNSDNFERVMYKVNEALGRIKITARGKRHTDTQPLSESLSVMTTDNKMSGNPKFSSSAFQKNQPAAVLTPKSYYTKEGLTAKAYIGNITNLPVDCVVVAENGFLWHGVGVALAISKAAGEDFDQEGEAYIRTNGAVPVTQCCVTSAGRLPYKAVIHAVGPKWSDYKDNEKERYIDDLIQTIVNCLIEANKLKMVSTAILAFSSGIFGVPKQLCAQIYAKGVIEYSKTYGLQSVKEIHFVDTVSEMCQLTQSAFDKELQCS